MSFIPASLCLGGRSTAASARSAFSSDHSVHNDDDADGDDTDDCGGHNMIQGITAIVLETSQQLIRKNEFLFSGQKQENHLLSSF